MGAVCQRASGAGRARYTSEALLEERPAGAGAREDDKRFGWRVNRLPEIRLGGASWRCQRGISRRRGSRRY